MPLTLTDYLAEMPARAVDPMGDLSSETIAFIIMGLATAKAASLNGSNEERASVIAWLAHATSAAAAQLTTYVHTSYSLGVLSDYGREYEVRRDIDILTDALVALGAKEVRALHFSKIAVGADWRTLFKNAEKVRVDDFGDVSVPQTVLVYAA